MFILRYIVLKLATSHKTFCDQEKYFSEVIFLHIYSYNKII